MNNIREDMIYGRNAVTELLKSQRPVDVLYIQSGLERQGSIGAIIKLARQREMPIKELPRERLDALCGGPHQGVAASAAAARYYELEEILEAAGEQPPFLVVADGIQDPHNLGAIIRTADAAGAHGLIIPKRGGVGLTPTVLKASAGAAAHFPVARVPNLAACLEVLKKRGIWCYCASPDGPLWCKQDYAGPVALVVGAEGEGVSRLVRERCDFVVSLPMQGHISSLNASVAAGIILYEIARQRMGL
jgi:23S rRNA (guanosine2251-2'-O)-methyltransferase